MQANNIQNDQPQPSSPEPKQNFINQQLSKHKFIWYFGSLVFILIIVISLYSMFRQSQNDSQKSTEQSSNQQTTTKNDSLFLQQYGQECKERDVKFTSAPMRMSDLALIRPLGAVSDGHVTPTDHVYIGAGNPTAADNTYPVLMPADGTITTVAAMPAQYIGDRQDQKVAVEDHRIVISHSCRYFSIYIHIHKLSDKLKAVVGTLQPNESKNANVELEAGETVGYIGNSTFDWTPIDTSTRLTGFITSALYQGESWKIHTVSPFDLYTGTLKTELEAKSLRSAAPIGGKIDYDQPGKLIGNWFRQGTGGYAGNSQNGGGRYWDGHLSVVPDYIDPTSTIVSIGNWTGNAAQFVVNGSVNPSKITKNDGPVKYELKKLNYVTPDNMGNTGNSFIKGLRPSQDSQTEGTILFQVIDGEELKVEKFPGKTAAQVSGFTSAAAIYER